MRHRSSLLGGGFLAVGLLFALGVRTGWIDLTPVVCLVVECPEEDGLDFQSLPEGVPAVAGTSAPTPADPPFTLLTQLNRQGGQFSISPAGQFIRESGVLTAAVNDLNEQLTLDRTVPIIVGRACGEVNAFYDPNQREIVFCDEPSAGLDPIVAAGLDNVLRQFQSLFNMTMVVVTHELESIKILADRVVMLSKGRILAEGPVDEMMDSDDEEVHDFFHRIAPNYAKSGTAMLDTLDVDR